MTALSMFAGDSQTITVTVLDEFGDPFNLTLWTISFSAVSGAITITKAGTSAVPASGVATVVLDPADTASLTANVTSFAWSVRITDGTDVHTVDTGTLVVTKVPNEAGPSTVATCTLSGALANGAGAAMANEFVRARIIDCHESGFVSDDGPVSIGAAVVMTDASGAWSFTFPQGARVRVEIPAAGIDHVGTLPEASTSAFTDLYPSMWRYR